MARIKGGLNAKKKHNRVLKLAKGYRGARSKQYRIAKQSVMRALASSYAGRKEEASVPSAVDCTYQRCRKAERLILQQVHVWLEAGRRGDEPQDAGRDGCKRCRRLHYIG